MKTSVQHKTMEHKVMRRVYVFSSPIRIFHWLNALSIVVLIITGFIMANPPAIQQGHEASFGYWFGTVRFIHFAAAYIFTGGFVFRVYMLFAGNRYERLHNFVPTQPKFLSELIKVIKIDILLKKNKLHFVIGHNAMAGMSYFILFIFMLIMILTGFAMYANMTTSFFAQWFNWVTPLLGGDIMVRIVHHVSMWVFILFTLIHVYLVMFHDYVEGHGETSSMIGGWKFLEKEKLDEYQKQNK